MRTGAFSDAEMIKTLNSSFVCAWVNKRPMQQFKDGLYKGKNVQLNNGTAPDNVTSVFAAWDGTVLHAMMGSLDTAAFKEELAFALDLYDKTYEGVGRKAMAGATYMGLHKDAADKAKSPLVHQMHWRLSKSFTDIRDWYPTLFEKLFGR